MTKSGKIAALPLLLGAVAGVAFFAARTPPESPEPDDSSIAEFATGAVAELARAFPAPGRQHVPRDAHPKAHGCVKAVFEVDPALPDDLRVESFSRPGQKFKAWIRFSNGAATPGPDKNPDFRGMAVKLIDADPDRADPSRAQPPHDILMVNYPVFFLSGLGDLRALMRAGAFRADGESLKPYFFPDANPFTWRLRAAWIAYRNATRAIETPLGADYFSMTPYAFGPDRAIKYAARPCAAAPVPAPSMDDPDFLRHALQRDLRAAPACFALFAQVGSGDMPLDDATREWPQTTAPLRLLGRLKLAEQDIGAPGRDEFCENMSFNPGHAPAALAPLGGINRARVVIYERIAAYRLGRNAATPVEPGQAWDRF